MLPSHGVGVTSTVSLRQSGQYGHADRPRRSPRSLALVPVQPPRALEEFLHARTNRGIQGSERLARVQDRTAVVTVC